MHRLPDRSAEAEPRELEQLIGRQLETLGDVVDCRRGLVERGVRDGAGEPRAGRRGRSWTGPAATPRARRPIDDVDQRGRRGRRLLAGYLADDGSTMPPSRPRSPGRSRHAARRERGCVGFAPEDRDAVIIHPTIERAAGAARHDRTERAARAASQRRAGVAIGPWAIGRAGATARRPVASTADQVRRRARPDRARRDRRLPRRRTSASWRSEVRDAGHEAEAAIFAAQAEMARDPALDRRRREQMTRNGLDAVGAVIAASRSIAEHARRSGRRAACGTGRPTSCDVGDRIARHARRVCQSEAHAAGPAIVVDDDLSPSMTATLPRERLLGIVLAGSSPTAHAGDPRARLRHPGGRRSAAAAVEAIRAAPPGSDARHRRRHGRDRHRPGSAETRRRFEG